MDAYALDFAALRVLQRVYAHRSFSRAAESLGVGQSSISYTVARLRKTFDDPLFVRQGSVIVATTRCSEIMNGIKPMLESYEALVAPRIFEAATAELEVTISCNFYERITILPELVRLLRVDAPGIKLNIIPSQVRGREQLKRGECDLLIGPIRLEEAGYFRRSLFTDRYVCIMDPANPLAGTEVTDQIFDVTPQVVVNYGGAFRSGFLIEMERQGRRPSTVVEIPSPANLPSILRGTDMIATVPMQTALHFGSAVAIVPCPLKAEVKIDLQWAPRTHESAPHIWLRQQIAEAAARHLAHSTD